MTISLPRKRTRARERGNMLVMIALVGGIIIAVVVIGIGVMLLLFSQQRGRQSADEMALTLAQVLNRDDRQGQMNNLVERSRELVYSSRTAYEDCVSNEFHNMEPLMRELLQESRGGAQTVEKTREQLSEVIVADLQRAKKDFDEKLKQANSLNLSWIKTSVPVVKQLEVGSIEKVNSNVSASTGLPELKAIDEKNGICDPTTGIYSGNINAKLPGADSDLDFKLSSLAAPVGTTISAARLTAAGVFKQSKVLPLTDSGGGGGTPADGSGVSSGASTPQSADEKRQAQRVDQIPSAVRVKLTVSVAAGNNSPLKDNLGVTTAATAGGAQPAPDLP